MDRLSDHHIDVHHKPPSSEDTAKKGYPGLVLVPPSDRTILRRRIIRGALLLVAGIWTVSAFTARPPGPDINTACQSETGQPQTEDTSKNCDQPSAPAQIDTHSNEFSLTQASQAEGLTESSNLANVPTSDSDPSPTPHLAEQAIPPKQADSISHHSNQPEQTAGNETSTSSQPLEKSIPSLDVDTQLAAQGDAFAQYRLGRYYARRDRSQTPESIGWYKKASSGLHRLAESGNAQAMYVLGVMYAYGRGVSKDPEQARHWLTQAIEHKITAAQPVLANLPASPHSNSHLHAAEQVKVRKQQN